MRVDLSEYGLRPGDREEISVRYDGGELDIGGSIYPVVSSDEPVFELTCPDKGRVHLEGSLSLTAMGVCDRCLSEVPVSLTARVSEDLEFTEEKSEIDIQELLDREFLLEWPMKILCKPDCAGLCSICGKNLNEGACGCDRERRDTRMSAMLESFMNSFGDPK